MDCCESPYGGQHTIQCVNYEPPLTQEEIRLLRQTILHGSIPA